jgi:UDP-2,3-diacylglucosamine pyrophosphatase LpxH
MASERAWTACDHIHHAGTQLIKGIPYCNDGDWVESRTALPKIRGRLEIVNSVDAGSRRT